MENSKLKELLIRQQEIGSEIERIIANFKKDGKERKTPEYVAERLRRLQSSAELLNDVQKEILALTAASEDNVETFKSYYANISEMVVKYTKILEQMGMHPLETQFDTAETDGRIGPCTSRLSAGAGAVPKQPKPSLSPATLKLLRNQRALMRALERNINELAANQGSPQTTAYYTTKYAIIERHMSEFHENNNLLWETTVEDHIEEYTPQTFFDMEERVGAAMVELQQHLPKEASASPSQEARQQRNEVEVSLPRIPVPTFNGNYMQWMAFKDLYVELVHKANISDARKFHYLVQALTGEPKGLIQHLPAVGENYEAAWSILTNRYDNKRLIVTSLLNKLLMQPAIRNESSTSIKALHDVTKECMHGLAAQGLPVHHWDALITHSLIKKLDAPTQALFEQGLDDHRRLVTLNEVLNFLEHRFQSLEVRGKSESTSKTCATAIENDNKCKICKGSSHPLYSCSKFISATIRERWQCVAQQKLCANCLKPGHRAKACNRQHCTKCTKKHNTLLHYEGPGQMARKVTEHPIKADSKTCMTGAERANTVAAADTGKVSLIANTTNSSGKYVLLGTALIQLTAANGNLIECRALLDSCSQVNLITERLHKKLGGTIRVGQTSVEGIGASENKMRHRTSLRLQSRCSSFSVNLEAHVLPKIVSNQPTQQLQIETWNMPKDINLADPEFGTPGRIDCLLGAEFYYDLMKHGKINLGEGLPILQNTVFGWIVAGGIENAHSRTTTCAVCTTKDLENTISKFWELEEAVHSNTNLTEDELRCETHFVQHTTRAEDGKFVVRLPLKEHPSVLGKSKPMAISRFLALERRLSQDPELRTQYSKFMDEYERLGHMERIGWEDVTKDHFIIPHHCVLRPENTTTKLRVVFDASARSTNGISLNDIMFNGPIVQGELLSLLLRFRTYKFVLKTDIEKMYRQMWVHPEDQKLQLIIWRNNAAEQLRVYQLKTITYGTRAAPYLATRCLNQLADEYRDLFPQGADCLRTGFYVDDGLFGADTIKEALEKQEQLINILGKAGMHPRKWCANHPRLLNHIVPENQEISLDFESTENQQVKTLGLLWLPKLDVFRIKTNVNQAVVSTKRTMTSDLARIYDPLGLIGPVVVTAKLYIQHLWQLKIDWDAELPTEMHHEWKRFRAELPHLDNVTVPRYVFGNTKPINIQLHVFADASEKAYGAAVYIRSLQADKSIKVQLLCSKSRVAPLKQQTIPRLELCAALLAAELLTRVKSDLQYQHKVSYLWTDSTIVLSWIKNHPGTLPIFVAHRIIKINQLTNSDQWRHVPSKSNPADLLSRGIRPKDLQSCHMWFYGPLLLYQPVSTWPASSKESSTAETAAVIMAASANQGNNEEDHSLIYSIETRNSFKHLQRTLGYILRFTRNCRKAKPSRPETKELSPLELKDALRFIIHEIQASSFKELCQTLRKHGRVPNSNALNSLTPFLDEEGLIRVGGRLESSPVDYNAKHQFLLPRDDPITKLLVEGVHQSNFHCGPSALLAEVKQQFWPLDGRSLARSVVHHCVRCTRSRPVMYKQMMGNLPALRVEPARPFIHSGVDYCGPFKVHFKTRGKPPQKAYICVFCCFATKAVHLELVTDLTTDAFVGALKRFISRRGHCKTIICDNATNFVGARNLLTDVKETIHSPTASQSIIRKCSDMGIEFKFIPPRTPHFGGLWEAAVKSTKKLLATKLYEAKMTFEELNTVVTEVEAMLNSRPLTPMSSDPNDLRALTPGHFLVGEPLTTTVDVQSLPAKSSTTARWEEVSKLKHSFWKRWTTEYLSELQQRRKWRDSVTTIAPGTMVIIKEDNCPVLHWPLGRITKVYSGVDGLVRVCDVKTQRGIIQRSVHRLAPLFPEERSSTNVDGADVHSNVKNPNAVNVSLPISIPLNKINIGAVPEMGATPRKIRRMQPNLIFAVLAILFLPLILANPLTITPFEKKLGIYFEQLGTMKRITSTWNIVVYYDLQPYRDQLDLITNGTNRLQTLCEQRTTDAPCSFLTQYFDHARERLEAELKILTVKRAKRGAVDLVGNVANSLFGILDSNYAAKMSETISHLQQNDNHLEQLFRNQTSLINSTINVFKGDLLAIRAKFEELDRQIHDILHGNSTALSGSVTILTLAMQLLMVLANLQEIHSLIMDVLIDSHHGKINPFLITPVQLETEILRIKAHMPSDLQLPFHRDNVLKAYKLAKIDGMVAKNHIVFNIELPLTDAGTFNLLHLVPIPIAMNSGLTSVKVSSRFMAISPHHDEFIPLTQEEFQSCVTVGDNKWLCPNTQASYQRSSLVCQCELDTLNDESEPNCELRTKNESIQWHQLMQPNQWIYATTRELRMTVVCEDDHHQLTLRSSGLLQLRSDCTIKNGGFTIRGHHKFITSLQGRGAQLEGFSGWARQYWLNSTISKAFAVNVTDLDLIQQQLAQLKTSSLFYESITTNTHPLIVSYSAVGIALVLGIFLTISLLKRYRQKAPIPAPRSTTTCTEC